ncbi:MAG: hypothetical protein AAF490_18515 [Chloroflexota bacterium]
MMKKARKFLKATGKILLAIVLVFVVLIGAFVVWIRRETPVVTSCEAGFQLIEHGGGADCVVDDPNKILVVSSGMAQLFIAVGHPAGAKAEGLDLNFTADIPGLYERFSAINKDAVDFGAMQANLASMELLLESEFDAIVSELSFGDSFDKPLQAVAPFIILSHLDSWKEVTLFSGELIDEKEQAEALLDEYERRVQILQAQFDDPSQITISNVSLYPEKAELRLPASFAGQIIREVGFSFPEAQLALVEDTPDLSLFAVSDEKLDLVDADHLFYYAGWRDGTFEANDSTASFVVDAFTDDPLFQLLAAAEANQAYEADFYWTTPGIYSVHAVLDDLFRHVAGVDPDEVAPNPLRLE